MATLLGEATQEKSRLELTFDELSKDTKALETAEQTAQKELDEQKQRTAELKSEVETCSIELNHVEENCKALSVPYPPTADSLLLIIAEMEAKQEAVRQLGEKVTTLKAPLQAASAQENRRAAENKLESLRKSKEKHDARCKAARDIAEAFKRIKKILDRQRDDSISAHVETYGPLITVLQQRLRAVYGFGGIKISAHGGEARVEVDWQGKPVKPVDYFSDSQKQILMLSVFLAGCLRQNWSGFAPVLLDDPVTHFDDLNAYAFVELVRGLVSTEPKRWQFIISTCEDRLFSLMHKKFATVKGGAKFYRFEGITDSGPIVEPM